MCIKDKSKYSLKGDWYSTNFTYLEIRLNKCNSKVQKCKSDAEINEFFDPSIFSFAFINSFFDFTDYNKPIKKFIDDSLFFPVESSKEKSANVYVMKGQTNLEDEIFQIGNSA